MALRIPDSHTSWFACKGIGRTICRPAPDENLRKKKDTYFSPAPRVKDHIGFSGQLIQPFPVRLFDLDADCAPWQRLAEVPNALQCRRWDSTLVWFSCPLDRGPKGLNYSQVTTRCICNFNSPRNATRSRRRRVCRQTHRRLSRIHRPSSLAGRCG